MNPKVRFAPSPTGYLHLGHAYSARFAQNTGQGQMRLRLDDIDQGRCREIYEAAIFEDLAWLGLEWESPVTRSNDHLEEHAACLDRLRENGWVYRCFRTRREVAEASSSAPHGPLGPRITGLLPRCEAAESDARATRGEPYAWRLDSEGALEAFPGLTWQDYERGHQAVRSADVDDVVVARDDRPTSYHLSIVCDDAREGIDLVTRGRDLLPSTPIHRLLQALLDLPSPAYWHHGLVVDAEGRRLSKREHGTTIRSLRADALSPGAVWQLVDQGLERDE